MPAKNGKLLSVKEILLRLQEVPALSANDVIESLMAISRAEPDLDCETKPDCHNVPRWQSHNVGECGVFGAVIDPLRTDSAALQRLAGAADG